jgi:hypothetical protein
MRARYLILIIVLFCLTFKAFGQQVLTIRGVVSKKLSGERIGHVIIANLKTGNIIESDDVGWFTVKASIGDTLQFTKTDFTPQKIVVVTASDLPVYLQPVIKLNQVTIQGQTKKQELKDVMSDYRKDGTFYNGKPPVLSFLTSPITGLYELFGATPNRAKHFAQFSKGEEEYAEVHRRYNVAFVKRITGATDTIALRFMKYYTPDYDALKGMNDYELIRDTQKAYEFYQSSPDKEALENLNTPPPLIEPEKKKTINVPPTVYKN